MWHQVSLKTRVCLGLEQRQTRALPSTAGSRRHHVRASLPPPLTTSQSLKRRALQLRHAHKATIRTPSPSAVTFRRDPPLYRLATWLIAKQWSRKTGAQSPAHNATDHLKHIIPAAPKHGGLTRLNSWGLAKKKKNNNSESSWTGRGRGADTLWGAVG